MQRPLRLVQFNLDYKKLIACLTYFAQHSNDLTKLKAVKLLYFLDKNHLLKHGRPVLGDNYVRMGYGPVPSMTLDIINEIIDENQSRVKMLDPENRQYFDKFLKIKPAKYATLSAINDPDLTVLSETEREALSETVKVYGRYATSTLVDKSHNDATCKRTELNHYIDYKLFFEGEKNTDPHAIEYFKNLEEDVSFLNVLDATA